MSDGSQIGGFIGAAIGYYITLSPQGAQLGYAIGPAVGGYVDPEVVLGPLVAADSGITAEGIPQ
ncbi:hypothetical protein LJR168_001770 [Pseudoxanthomonas sp. LjRoot168]|uniref:hypothetical protein n=1 Tax=unclassified Pseudoxanthomonas TaxID=2645906 RepID=UPI003ECFC9B1